MSELVFCPRCGAEGLHVRANKLSCDRCDLVLYQNVAATASLVLRCDGEVLMSQRGQDPQKGKFDFPGGFVEAGESLEEALERELYEETGFQPHGYQYLMSTANRYPYRDITYDLCDAYFLMGVEAKPDLRPADDVSDLAWKNLANLDRSEVAFDSVWQVIEKLRSDVNKREESS